MSGELGLFNQNNFIKALQKYKKKTICTTLLNNGYILSKTKEAPYGASFVLCEFVKVLVLLQQDSFQLLLPLRFEV